MTAKLTANSATRTYGPTWKYLKDHNETKKHKMRCLPAVKAFTKLEESALSPEKKQVVLTRCMDLLKELLVQYQMRLPASMELLWKLELLCPASVVSNRSPVQVA
ncbi:hypothetical protein SKAU_G00237820 [Synaphobranchus kaupii]|uniref:Uncharacterized protein n=1 Tax=Synaphobranchus kaupii TaxID=118154 RepID=A0A9Q1F6Z1_SYNKA|nr:hypothetical protein SKAU_G00237820 [Synaphobranchus kaupii]